MNNRSTKRTARARRQTGLSLVELMISLAISLFVIAGVLYVFLGSRQAYTQNDAMARLQENGRIAADLIAHDLRMAGFMGCRRYGTNEIRVIANAPPFQTADIVEEQAIRGVVYANTPNPAYVMDSSGNGGVVGSDVIIIRHASADGVRLGGAATTLVNPGSTSIDLVPVPATVPSRIPGAADGTPLTAGQAGRNLALITDCVKGDIFRVTGVAGGTAAATTVTLTSNAGLSWGFGPNAMVYPVREDRYFLRNTGRVNAQNQPIISLFRLAAEVAPDNAEELVEGVEDMRMEYGIDNNGDGEADVYSAVAAVGTAWDQVVSVRVRLQLATVDDNVLAENTAFPGLNGVPVTDRKMRQEFSAVVAFRNRLK